MKEENLREAVEQRKTEGASLATKLYKTQESDPRLEQDNTYKCTLVSERGKLSIHQIVNDETYVPGYGYHDRDAYLRTFTREFCVKWAGKTVLCANKYSDNNPYHMSGEDFFPEDISRYLPDKEWLTACSSYMREVRSEICTRKREEERRAIEQEDRLRLAQIIEERKAKKEFRKRAKSNFGI